MQVQRDTQARPTVTTIPETPPSAVKVCEIKNLEWAKYSLYCLTQVQPDKTGITVIPKTPPSEVKVSII